MLMRVCPSRSAVFAGTRSLTILLVSTFTPLPPATTLALHLAFLPMTSNARGYCATRVRWVGRVCRGGGSRDCIGVECGRWACTPYLLPRTCKSRPLGLTHPQQPARSGTDVCPRPSSLPLRAAAV